MQVDGSGKSVILIGQQGHSVIVRKDITICGGGLMQLTDSALLPYPM